MVIGPESEGYRTMRYLVERLPAMIAPAWLRNRTQPIAIEDVLEYLIQARRAPGVGAAARSRSAGPTWSTYGEPARPDGRRARSCADARSCRCRC